MHAGSSTFELPDLCPHFPYLSADKCNMTEEEFSYHLFNLNRHTSKVKAAFAGVVLDLQRDILPSKLKEVINFLAVFDSKFKNLLSNCDNMTQLFEKIIEHFSFFDFELIKLLTKKFASLSVKRRLAKYKAMFKEYSERRVVECPSDAFGDHEKSEKVFVLKLDKILNSLTAEELRQLCNKIKSILKHEALRLLHVKDGCIQLTFRGFEEEDFNIIEEQQQALRNIGVLCISYGENVLDISKFTKQNSQECFGELCP